MALIVVKFGGTSVGDVDRIKNAAGKVVAEVNLGNKVVVVVSAMAGTTDRLVSYCRALSPMADTREYDAVVAAGEQVTSGLMALALQHYGLKARSWQGWQLPLKTDFQHSKARIEGIETERLLASLADGEVAVVAGFQGVDADGRISTLGRGGSDTSAVAIAAAVKADRCDIYTDVDGVYTADPRICPKARKMKTVRFCEMLELASLGAKVLQTRSVEMAARHHVPLQVLSTFSAMLGSELPGTLITDHQEASMEDKIVTGIAHSLNEGKITLSGLPDRSGVAATVFTLLAQEGIDIDMIVQTTVSAKGDTTTITFTTNRTEIDRALQVLEKNKSVVGFSHMISDKTVAKLSLIGLGMSGRAGIAATMFNTLAGKKINIQAIETSEISISILIDESYVAEAAQALHTAFGLDASGLSNEGVSAQIQRLARAR